MGPAICPRSLSSLWTVEQLGYIVLIAEEMGEFVINNCNYDDVNVALSLNLKIVGRYVQPDNELQFFS